MTYENRAKSILKDAIKSAIYIDEKAKSFYECEPIAENNIEEKLSIDLYNNFKENGISLEVHKFKNTDLDNENTLNFIVSNRDFVILDWKLIGSSGEESSLKLLNRIVECPHINFCTIYTSIDNLDEVINNVISYFSGKTKEYYESILELIEIEDFENEIIEIFHQINFNRSDLKKIKILRGSLYQKDKEIIQKLKNITSEADDTCAIIKASIALSKTYKSDLELYCPSFVNPENKIVVINNTIITILSKDQNDANSLLNNFKDHIIRDVDSFNQLLGIELYNHLFRTSAITNDSIISFSIDALFNHRCALKIENNGHFFNSFIDEILLEKISLSLRNRDSLLLNDELLDEFENDLDKAYNDQIALHKMNVFYNSFFLDKNQQTINFGDVFLMDENENHSSKPKYLICITALCDCLRPQDKIRSNYYFAEGKNINKGDALALGDGAFISYLQNEITILWSDISIEKLNQTYGPVYIKPLQYKVFEDSNAIDENNKIQVHYLDKKGETKTEILTYIGTIRPNYTQRIANHAFSYPIRVGVDFVKL